MKTLFLVRHGETGWNAERRVMGRRQIPLNRKGVLQATRMARILPGLGIDAIYSSPLKRTLETSRILAETTGVPMEIDFNLTEVAFGRWEGCQPDELLRDEAYRHFLRAPLEAVVPGGETIQDVQKRGLRVIRWAARKFPKGRLLFVTHADIIRAIICHYLRLPLEEFRRLRIDNGSLSALEVYGTWAAIKFMNYLPDVTQIGKEPYLGLEARVIKRKNPKPTS